MINAVLRLEVAIPDADDDLVAVDRLYQPTHAPPILRPLDRVARLEVCRHGAHTTFEYPRSEHDDQGHSTRHLRFRMPEDIRLRQGQVGGQPETLDHAVQLASEAKAWPSGQSIF